MIISTQPTWAVPATDTVTDPLKEKARGIQNYLREILGKYNQEWRPLPSTVSKIMELEARYRKEKKRLFPSKIRLMAISEEAIIYTDPTVIFMDSYHSPYKLSPHDIFRRYINKKEENRRANNVYATPSVEEITLALQQFNHPASVHELTVLVMDQLQVAYPTVYHLLTTNNG